MKYLIYVLCTICFCGNADIGHPHPFFPIIDNVFARASHDPLLIRALKTKTTLTLHFSLPGFDKKDVSIAIKNNHMLTLKAEQKLSLDKGTEVVLGSTHTTKSTSFSLPEDIDPSSVKARMDKGILSVTFTIKKECGGKSITIT